MSKKEALRELQQRLAERLKAAQSTTEVAMSWLAVEVGGHGFLLPLTEAGEIFPVLAINRVPHTATWLRGVTSLRGNLFTVVDLARLFGLTPVTPSVPHRSEASDGSRLVTFNASQQINAAVLIDGLVGLRQAGQLEALPPQSQSTKTPRFVGARYRDNQGRVWQELRLAELASHDHFLDVRAAA